MLPVVFCPQSILKLYPVYCFSSAKKSMLRLAQKAPVSRLSLTTSLSVPLSQTQ